MWKCNQFRRGFELVLPCPYPTTITITPRSHPKEKKEKNDTNSFLVWLLFFNFILVSTNDFMYFYIVFLGIVITFWEAVIAAQEMRERDWERERERERESRERERERERERFITGLFKIEEKRYRKKEKKSFDII